MANFGLKLHAESGRDPVFTEERNRLYMTTLPLDDLPDYFIKEPWGKA